MELEKGRVACVSPDGLLAEPKPDRKAVGGDFGPRHDPDITSLLQQSAGLLDRVRRYGKIDVTCPLEPERVVSEPVQRRPLDEQVGKACSLEQTMDAERLGGECEILASDFMGFVPQAGGDFGGGLDTGALQTVPDQALHTLPPHDAQKARPVDVR